MNIYFDGSQFGIQIPPLQFQTWYTIENLYQHLQQECQIDTSQFFLSDGQSLLSPQDMRQIGSFIQPNTILPIIQLPQPQFTIYVDGQQVHQCALPNMIITELVNILKQQGLIFSQNLALDIYDEQQQLIAQDVDINQLLYNYTQGNQFVSINIKSIQQDIQSVEDKKVPSQIINPGAQDLLQQLILLKNLSLLIDPNNQFVVYKFHFPTQVQGYLQKSKGKDPEHFTQFNFQKQDWIEKNSIKYCSFDDYGFAIWWDDGNLSSVRIVQQ